MVMITDLETQLIADAIYHEAAAISSVKHPVFIMEKFGERHEDGSNPIKFPKRLQKNLLMLS